MRQNVVPKIPCEKCLGAGKIPLHPHLFQTLNRIPKTGATADDLVCDGVTTNAISNRLNSLLALGFVQRVREGKFLRYFRLGMSDWTAIKQAKKARV